MLYFFRVSALTALRYAGFCFNLEIVFFLNKSYDENFSEHLDSDYKIRNNVYYIESTPHTIERTPVYPQSDTSHASTSSDEEFIYGD